MPRKSAASLSVAPPPARTSRLPAPSGLTPTQAAIWRDVVDVLPADYFGHEQAPQLVTYCRHAALASDLAQRLATLDPLAEGWAKLSAAQVSHSKAALAYARSLRLTMQSRVQPDTAGNKAKRTGPATLELLRSRYEVQQ